MKIKNRECKVFDSILSPDIQVCQVCGVIGGRITRHGTKASLVKINQVVGFDAYLRLRKQRYFCHECNSTFIATTSLVEKNSSISNPVKLQILLLAKHAMSEKTIAELVGVSHQTVHLIIQSCQKYFQQTYDYLPTFLGFDEFKSVDAADGAMSFVYCDAYNREILDVVEDRRLESLIAYFMRFPLSVRRRVQGIVIDMYQPYVQLIEECFPNASIIIDRFHIAQHMVRAMNGIRIKIMKDFDQDSLEYKLLKKYWKHRLKPRTKRKEGRWYCRHLRRRIDSHELVELLLSYSEELKENWLAFQNMYNSFRLRDGVRFFGWLKRYQSGLHEKLTTVIDTFLKLSSFIENSFRTKLSNGVLEGINNKIKLIKRLGYGYRSFVNLRLRIMLCFTLTKKVGHPV
jgi:transposase